MTKHNLNRKKNLTTLFPEGEKHTNISNRHELATIELDALS